MELDLKKKIIIGAFIAVVLIISCYLYYEFINNSNNTINIENDFEEDGEKSGSKKDKLENGKNTNEENIIIIHIAGAVKNPRNCENKRGFKII